MTTWSIHLEITPSWMMSLVRLMSQTATKRNQVLNQVLILTQNNSVLLSLMGSPVRWVALFF